MTTIVVVVVVVDLSLPPSGPRSGSGPQRKWVAISRRCRSPGLRTCMIDRERERASPGEVIISTNDGGIAGGVGQGQRLFWGRGEQLALARALALAFKTY